MKELATIRRVRGAAVPDPWGVPLNDESVDERFEEVAAAQVEESDVNRALDGDFAAVLERSPQPGPLLAVCDEDHPVPLRFGGELPRRDALEPCVFPDLGLGQILPRKPNFSPVLKLCRITRMLSRPMSGSCSALIAAST